MAGAIWLIDSGYLIMERYSCLCFVEMIPGPVMRSARGFEGTLDSEAFVFTIQGSNSRYTECENMLLRTRFIVPSESLI